MSCRDARRHRGFSTRRSRSARESRAWRSVWRGPRRGDVLFVEARAWPGTGTLTLTGHLGDVMKESARAALSWVRPTPPLRSRRASSQQRRGSPARAVGSHPKDARPRRDHGDAARVRAVGPPGSRRPGDDREITLSAACCRSAASRRRSWPPAGTALRNVICRRRTRRT